MHLQYSGGSGTHNSAYNCRANLIAAKLARLINKDVGKIKRLKPDRCTEN